jgi:hypothetical protein
MTQNNKANEVLKAMFSQDGISFKNNDGWNTLAEHVEVHNQYLNQALKQKVSWDDALFSWYENIYSPIKRAINTRKMRTAFPQMTTGELYLAVSDHWFYLKEQFEDVSPEDTAYNFAHISKDRSSNLLTRLFKAPALSKETDPHGRKAA